jgi:hypothetical protein
MIASQLIQPSARAALEHYKIRDTSKGMSFLSPLSCYVRTNRGSESLIGSGGEIQINRFGTHNEDHCIQSNSFKPISSCNSILKGSTRFQSY